MKFACVTEEENAEGRRETVKLFASTVIDSRTISVSGISEASVQLQQPKLPSAIRVGGEIELRCHVDGSGDIKYEWFRFVT